MSAARTASLLAANLTTGLAAGVFALYEHTIMPGLRSTDDRTFVVAFKAIDRSIVNPWFMSTTFVGALVAAAVSAVVNRGEPAGRAAAIALLAYVVTVIITAAVHLPLNDAIKAAGDPTRLADAAAVRARFHETRWVAWNLVRVVTSATAFSATAWALAANGRSTS